MKTPNKKKKIEKLVDSDIVNVDYYEIECLPIRPTVYASSGHSASSPV